MCVIPKNKVLNLDRDLLHKLYVEERLSSAQIAKLLECSDSSVIKYVNLYGFWRGHTKKYASPEMRRQIRASHDFSKEIKKQRFFEEEGVCQFCHELIGDGLTWSDRVLHTQVAYHHDPLVCQGGTNKAEHCIVVHRKCHGGRGTGLPLNPELHGGRKIRFAPRISTQCVWCQTFKKIDSLHLCAACRLRRLSKVCLKCGKVFHPTSSKTKFCKRECFITHIRYFTEEDLLRELQVAKGLRDLLLRLGCPLNKSTLRRVKESLLGMSSLAQFSKGLTQSLARTLTRGHAPRRNNDAL